MSRVNITNEDKRISKYLKHKPPILLVDEILELRARNSNPKPA